MRLPRAPCLRRLPPIASPTPAAQQLRKYSDEPPRVPTKMGFQQKTGSKRKGEKDPINFESTQVRVALARWMLFSHRPLRGLGLNPQDSIRHETIHRAWMMFRGKLRQEKVARLQSLQDSIHRTLMELRATDEGLYNIAVAGTRETEKRFPLVMRIPTHTLPLKRWNYSFNGTNIKGDGGVARPG
jgi:Mitochondrial ribosomal protein L28